MGGGGSYYKRVLPFGILFGAGMNVARNYELQQGRVVELMINFNFVFPCIII